MIKDGDCIVQDYEWPMVTPRSWCGEFGTMDESTIERENDDPEDQH